VPAIATGRSDPPALCSWAASLFTAARERAGLFEAITIAAFSSSRLPPLAKTPAEPIQDAKSRLACALLAPSAFSGASIAPSSDLTLMVVELGGPSEPVPVMVLPNELSVRSPWTSCASVLPRWPSPTASQDSPGSSPSAFAASASLESSPPAAPGEPEERVSVSTASEPAEAVSETLASRVPVSRASRPESRSPVPDAPVAPDALVPVGLE
jgi:hypothetical protein